MDAALTDQVRQRARGLCEYCRLPEAHTVIAFEVDHVIPRKHAGPTRLSNLAWSCFYCNSFKGSDLAGRDLRTRKLTALFNPRRHKWDRHFRWDGPSLVGRTAIGRVTVAVLQINHPARVAHRELLIRLGVFPPR